MDFLNRMNNLSISKESNKPKYWAELPGYMAEKERTFKKLASQK